jgi:hypothetical protein
MSYNILKKNVKFSGPADGTIEGMIDVSSSQEIVGDKTFTSTITSSADVMLSGSGKVSASFFYGDGSSLSGVSGVPAGTDGNIQFTDGSSLGASSNLTFFTSSNKLEVLGDISASVNVSASAFYGDGANLTFVTASFVTASNISGLVEANQIKRAPGLSNDAGFLTIDTASNGGITISSGLAIDANDLPSALWNSDGDTIVGYIAGNTRKIEFGELTDHLPINANNIDSGTLLNARLPTTIDISVVSASTGISGAFFQGDGSGLTGVTGAPTPVGSNTEIQFNADGALGSSAGLTFSTGSNRLSVTGEVSASSNALFGGYVSASSYAIDGGTIIDANADITCGNITMTDGVGTLNFGNNQISGSGIISGSQFYGDGSTLSNLPVGTYSNYTENRILAAGTAPDEIKGLSAVTFNNPTLNVVGNVSASINISASAFYGDGSALTGIGGSTTTEFHVATNSILAEAGKKFIPLSPGAGGSTMTSRANITTIFHSNKNFVQWIAPASGSIKQIAVNLTDVSTLYSIPITTGGNTTTSKDNIIFMLYKNNDENSLTNNFVGHITASAGDYSISSSVGRKFTIPCDTGLFSGSSTFDPGDVLKMGGFLPNANAGTSADAEIVITYELSGSGV